jgi:preprotein translocase subunit SecA
MSKDIASYFTVFSTKQIAAIYDKKHKYICDQDLKKIIKKFTTEIMTILFHCKMRN